MQLIAAVDKNWGIGKKGQQLVSIPADQTLFRMETQGRVVVMGKKTLLALPGERPLTGRRNLILTRDEKLQVKGADICRSMEETFTKLEEYKKQTGCCDDDIYVIGGQSVYEQFFPFCSTAHITYIDYEYEADTYMVNLDKEGWILEETGEEQTYFDLCYEFRRYRNPAVQK